jgi:hypothetical protein
MSVTFLSNDQLFALLHNQRLDASIHQEANEELERRNLSAQEWESLRQQYEMHYPPNDGPGLSIPEKLFLILVPAVFILQVLRVSRDLASNRRRRWKDFWLYVSIGYFVWTVLIIFVLRWIRR